MNDMHHPARLAITAGPVSGAVLPTCATSSGRRPMLQVLVMAAALAAAVHVGGCGSSTSQDSGTAAPPAAPTPTAAASSSSSSPSPAQTAASGMHFTDVTASSGVDFVTTCGALPATQILEVNGSGVAIFDYDRDGLPDIFIANGATMDDPERGPGSRLYRNLGGMRFADVTTQAGIAVTRWAMGVAVADIDGDGDEDLFIACYGPNILLRNNGDGTFTDVSQQAGIAEDHRWSVGAAFGDLTGDGALDLYVVNYLEFDPRNPPPRTQYKNINVMSGPHGLRPQHDQVFVNDGRGVFRDASIAFGMERVPPSYGMNAVILDVDDDGMQDVIVANDSMPDFLFVRESAATAMETGSTVMPRYAEIGVISGIASNADGGNQASMGMAIADVDGNGLPDKFVTVFSSDTNTLHLNVNGRLFEDRSTAYGLGISSRPYLGWACWFADLDHDGDEDLVMFNGHVYPEATMQTMESEYAQTPLLYGREGRRFRRVDADEGGGWLAQRHRDRATAFADLDNDGDIDMVVVELNGPVRILRNDAVERGGSGWITVRLRDERPESRNRDGLGARIDVMAGETRQRRWLFSGGGYQSSSPPIAHVGLGRGVETVTIIIRWPDGQEQTIRDVRVGQQVIVRRM